MTVQRVPPVQVALTLMGLSEPPEFFTSASKTTAALLSVHSATLAALSTVTTGLGMTVVEAVVSSVPSQLESPAVAVMVTSGQVSPVFWQVTVIFVSLATVPEYMGNSKGGRTGRGY